jgi:hypothetical protein
MPYLNWSLQVESTEEIKPRIKHFVSKRAHMRLTGEAPKDPVLEHYFSAQN